MELNNLKPNNLFDEDDDDILLNPILYINQFETNKNNNINTNIFQNENILESQNKNNHNSANSTLNTNAALDENSNEINYNISFFSFNRNQKNEEKKEMTQKSIEILSEFIEKEKKILENKNNISEIEDKKTKILKIKELKNNYEKLELSLKGYFKKPFMRKNYIFMKNFENKFDFDEEEKKINISDEIDINLDNTKKSYNDKKININNINNINEI